MTAAAPRVGDTLTTAEDVFALPHRAIVRGWHGQAYLVLNGGVFAAGNEKRLDVVDLNIGKPFTVLYVPGEQPCRHCGSCDGPPSCPDCDHADRPSVTDDTRAEAAAALRSTVDLDPRGDFDRGYAHGWYAAAEWAAGRAETTDERVVHNHGPTDGPGLDCPETILPDGGLRGACLNRAETTTATPPGLTVSEDGSVLNWQGVNYVPQRAETTTATTEDALDSLPYFTFEDDDVYPDEEFVRKADVARLLATARTRPTREQIDRAVGEVLSNAANHPDPVAVLGRSIAPLGNKVTDAVLALLRDGERRG